jgi:hypothetical protein
VMVVMMATALARSITIATIALPSRHLTSIAKMVMSSAPAIALG